MVAIVLVIRTSCTILLTSHWSSAPNGITLRTVAFLGSEPNCRKTSLYDASPNFCMEQSFSIEWIYVAKLTIFCSELSWISWYASEVFETSVTSGEYGRYVVSAGPKSLKSIRPSSVESTRILSRFSVFCHESIGWLLSTCLWLLTMTPNPSVCSVSGTAASMCFRLLFVLSVALRFSTTCSSSIAIFFKSTSNTEIRSICPCKSSPLPESSLFLGKVTAGNFFLRPCFLCGESLIELRSGSLFRGVVSYRDRCSDSSGVRSIFEISVLVVQHSFSLSRTKLVEDSVIDLEITKVDVGLEASSVILR